MKNLKTLLKVLESRVKEGKKSSFGPRKLSS